ncbi:3-oxoadipate enol-lactonase [Sphingomonas sp. NFX23]|uniref:3-oxoadipate enol-lactonase n=1 Tax=Sphingomonas sp. NFX23 TaxID=2819532 RepID=UPI003CE7B206
MPFVRSQDVEIYWKVEGRVSNPPLVLLNSIGTDLDLWASAIPTLRRNFMLLRIDTRGHGASDASDGDYEMQMLAGDVEAAMDAAGIKTATVAGVSLGGMIAMQLALDAPERVTGLALVCTSATMDPAAWTARVETVRTNGIEGIVDLAMGRFLSPQFISDHPDVEATIRRNLLTMDPAGYAGCGAAIRDMALAGRLGDIAMPTLVVTGTRDTSTPLEGHGEHLIARIRGARHVVLDAAHLAPLEAPDTLAAALIATLVH